MCYQLVRLFVDSVNPIRHCVGHIKLMDNVTYAERISGIFIGTGIRRERERGRERERESIRLPPVTCPGTDSITPCYSLSCGGVERHHLEDHLSEEMK